MTAAELQETFRISRETWHRITAEPGMINPIDPKYTRGETKWEAHGFVHWLAAHYPDLAHATPHLLRPATQVTPQYLGGRYTRPEADQYRPHEHFAGRWSTPLGVVAVIYGPRKPSPQEALDYHPDATTVVVTQFHYNHYGLPDLEAADRERPDLTYEPHWSELAAHVGSPVPWWPTRLLREEHLMDWKPGRRPSSVVVVTQPAWEPLHDLAYTQAKGSSLRIACLSISHEIRTRAIESAQNDLDDMNDIKADDSDYAQRRKAERACMTLPGYPDTENPAEAEVGFRGIVREGLAQLCQRTDDLAVECLENIKMWSGKDLPFGEAFSVTTKTTTPAASEWIQRLEPTEPTAIHRVWERKAEEVTGTFTDPVTRSPVVTKQGYYMFRPDDEVSYHSYAPRQLPVGSRVSEVILDSPVWIRTQRGTLYPAPAAEGRGLTWGYQGTGPGTLATLIGRLLDDGSSPAITSADDINTEPNLEAFLAGKYARGTVLSRDILLRIRRDGRLGPIDRLKIGKPHTER
ncbi:hypothetical protein [Streptomyces sp. GESEQ-4]|uniref:hypothetical protein n=1 Tax=Streptomyces sp. GESEQ-4 TaxID=2812655 RepID=UPI001B34319D|nr:hypothetical protein [Streptomyces sp. GESEQ-4]